MLAGDGFPGNSIISCDPARLPLRVDQAGATVTRFAYDGDGGRDRRIDASGTVLYLGSYEWNVGDGQHTTEVVTKYYQTLGMLIPFRHNGVLH